jgi:hypothetical protein
MSQKGKKANWVTMFQFQLKRLSGWGHDGAIEALSASIANGWQGVFEPARKTGFQNRSEQQVPWAGYADVNAMEAMGK